MYSGTGKFQLSGPRFQWETRQSLVSHWNGGPSGWDFPVPSEHQWWILFFLFAYLNQLLSHFHIVLISFSGKQETTPQQSQKDQKEFACIFCEKKFKFPSHLANHERGHTGEKPYSCEICGKAFRSKGSLKAHRITHLNTLAGH